MERDIASRRSFLRGIGGAAIAGLGVGALTQSASATGGEIDVKPGSDPSSFNPNSSGVVPVELLNCGQYKGDPVPGTNANVDSLRFGPPSAFADDGNVNNPEIEESIENGDGACVLHGGHVEGDSLVLHFDTDQAGFEHGDDVGMLIGRFEWPGGDDTRLIEATGSVNLVGGGKGNGKAGNP